MPPSCCTPCAPTRNATAVEAVTTTRPGSTDGMVQLAGGEFLMGNAGPHSYLDGDKAGEGRVEHTVPMLFSGDETTDVGRDSATPVSDDHGTDNAFSGRVRPRPPRRCRFGPIADHLVSAEERLRIAMARQ